MHFEEARDHFLKAIELDSTFASAHMGLAAAYLFLHSRDEKLRHLEKAMKFRDKLTHREQILLDHDYAMYKYTDLSKSINVLKEASSLYPKEKQIFAHLGYYYFQVTGELDTAIVYYNRVLELDPNEKWTLNRMGYIYRRKKDYAKAIEYFERYAKIAPKDENPYDSMAGLYLGMNNFSKSIEMYQKVLDITPDHIWGLTGIAANYIRMGEYQKARDQLNRALQTANSYNARQRTQHFLAILSIAEGDVDQAIRHMENRGEIMKQEGNIIDFAGNELSIAEILFEHGRIAGAEKKLEWFNKTIETSKLSEGEKDQAVLSYLSQTICLEVIKENISRARGLYNQYCENLDKKIKVSNKNMKWWENWRFGLSGLIAYAEGNYNIAISDLKQTGQKGPWVNYHLANSYLKIGDRTKAIERLKSTINYTGGPHITAEIYRRRAEEQLAILNADE
jgi:tetratricopeptide (TPR) repeat protein